MKPATVNTLRTIVANLIVWAATGYLAWAEEPSLPGPAQGAETSNQDRSLDALLLESLDAELLEGIDDLEKPASNPADPDPPKQQPGQPPSELDAQLLEQLAEGEDIGQESANPLAAIGRKMRLAEELIARRITSRQTQRVQDQIVADLDQLIEQLQSQCQSAGRQGGSQSQKPASKPGGKSRGGSGENRGENRPARDSTDSLGSAVPDDAELQRMKQMMKHVWGHLPLKVREQMQSGTIEEFLPKYERLIEDYYSRLAKEQM